MTDDVSAVVVPDLLAVCVNAADVLSGKTQPPPLKAAASEWLPTASALVVNVASPAPLTYQASPRRP